jgi:Holliday junction resolvasome RuvABC endonuclease subunit
MNVIGLDLSLTAPGLSVPDRTETLYTDAKRGDKRLCDIRDWLTHYAHTRAPVLAMIEAVPPYQSGSAILDLVHGVTREVLARYDIPFAYVSPSSLKQFATGDGWADKTAVMDAVEEMSGTRPADDNAADAWVLRRMGECLWADPFFHRGHHLQSLSSIAWPLKPGDPKWPQPYGKLTRKPVTKKCRHGVVCLRNGYEWLHPFDVAPCDKPPKGKAS